jgi:hypothetical protein
MIKKLNLLGVIIYHSAPKSKNILKYLFVINQALTKKQDELYNYLI